MTPLETLKAARDLISDPARWTQGEYARSKGYRKCTPQSKAAVCFCAHGAVEKFTGDVIGHPAAMALIKVCSDTHDCYVEEFNDTHTHAEVIALFDAAIAELEGV